MTRDDIDRLTAPRTPGELRRQELADRLRTVKQTAIFGGAIVTALFTILANRHTAAVQAAPLGGTGGATGSAVGQTPSQSLFTGQGDTSNNGGFLAPSPPSSSMGSRYRASSS